MGASGQSSACLNLLRPVGYCEGMRRVTAFRHLLFYNKKNSVRGCLFKICFISWSLWTLWNALHEQMSSERKAKHLVSAKWEIRSRSALSPLYKFTLHSLRFWLSIRQNAVVVWGQEEWLKANLTLSHLYVHLKHLIREMGLAWVWNQSNQNIAATWNSWRFLQRRAECNVLSAPSQSDTPVAGEGSLRSHLCTSWLFPLCLH